MSATPRPERAGLETRRGSDLRRWNAASILRALRDRGPLPRVDLAAALSLSSAGVTRLTAELVEHGLLRELEPVASVEVGRRRVPVDLSAGRFLAAGVHIGLQWTTFGLVDLRGRVVEGPHKIVHADTESRSVIDEVVGAVGKLVSARPDGSMVIGTGISSGGAVQQASGMVSDHDALGWHDVDVRALVGDRLDGPLVVESTYRAMATAEMWYGAARDIRSFAQVFLGRVYGAALVFDGVLHDGVDLRAGGIAHLPVAREAPLRCRCGRRGCLSSVTGPPATVEYAVRAGLSSVRSMTDVTDRAAHGDEVAQRVLRERAEAIGEAMSLLVEVLAPERVVLAGAALLTDNDLSTVRAAVRDRVGHPVEVDSVIVPTALGDAAVANVVASATPALKLFYDDPLSHVSAVRPAGAEL